ncbi:GNAT family N-acetyltransferase [Stackebrandtia nassauensis]|uniref:GCN5-related N-acetyltransferase n=1 Tax=Stackebrandtia nassauensis (strain DSM 44728 / CIP 108903 / NRRL B-16338 / NBRC 102104 / LLR-40K-21) TaxID=446470 RepID=D3Q4Z0_STANL|nr:GNAT family protein [Stackebrandtia nassauensis]ADD42170.1 GCN5-related N-acetyltransferase [Stackebrandtia nassauensis DSM 44728]
MPPSLKLRPIVMDDWTAVHDWARLDESCRYQGWGPNTEHETRAFVERAVAGWNVEPVRHRVYVAEVDGEIVGSGVLHFRDRRHRQGEISYGVHPKLWGRGLGTAVGAELLRVGFDGLGLHRIAATCDPRNRASAAVLGKLGMSFEGRMRHTRRIGDGWRDSDLYSILDGEWRPL